MQRPPNRKPLKPHWFQILLSLADQDLHGLQIMEEVSDRTDAAVHLWPGMLYAALKSMLEEGMDWTWFLGEMARRGYQGYVSVEGVTEPARDNLRGLAALMRNAAA